ncbi:MAG TPA: Maf family nucleotide pyrophosphatase [Burkholderiales bacterium]|jgi:septum formation protein|nr:Maf family nucleotide pyrophosphatase [Burkholderiales bacterium]
MAQRGGLVLASGSRYRKALLERLGLPFEALSPDVDETPLGAEAPADTALRLSLLKARALAHRGDLIIGADQVASCEGRRYDKPGTHDSAVRQLRELSGKTVEFHTAVTLLDSRKKTHESRLVPCRVVFRALDERRIQAYLERERPYDCSASAKAEGLGIALIERIETDDPSSLIGLPLIALTAMLERAGMPVL